MSEGYALSQDEFLDVLFKTIKASCDRNPMVHPHDIMNQVLTTVEEVYRFTEAMPHKVWSKQ